MRRLALVAVVLLVMSTVLPAAAQDTPTLAQYFPDTSPFYIQVRTDDDFLQTIDALTTKIATLLPNAQAGESFMDMIDTGIREDVDPNGSFATTIRPWLGDVAALGILNFGEEFVRTAQPALVMAIALTDADAAAAFFATSPEMDDFTIEEGDGFTLYSPEEDDDDPFVVIRSDVLIVTTEASIAQAGGVVEASLSENPVFAATLNALPLDAYDASAYLDTPAFFEAFARQDRSIDEDEWAMMEPMLAAIQPQAFGFVVQDGRALVFDAAAPLNTDSLPITVPTFAPIDPAFVQHIPANTVLVVQGTNLYGSYEYGIQSLRQLAETMSQTNDDFDIRDLNRALFGLNFAVRGVTGMEVDDAFGWMTGNYALALGLSSSFADSRSLMAAGNALPVDFALILEATDDAAVQSLFAGLAESVSALEANNIETETSADSIRLTINSNNTPFPIELVIAKNDDVFVIGTERMVRAALEPQNGMDSDPAFVEAGSYFLDGSSALLYVGSNALTPLARVMSAHDNPLSIQQQGKEVKAALEIFDSVAITTAALPDNAGSVMRFVWLLPD